jgi:hypothetical protein
MPLSTEKDPVVAWQWDPHLRIRAMADSVILVLDIAGAPALMQRRLINAADLSTTAVPLQ